MRLKLLALAAGLTVVVGYFSDAADDGHSGGECTPAVSKPIKFTRMYRADRQFSW
jgi:hypothetical protein